MEQTAPRTQSFSGTVVKTAMQETASVRVDRYVKHPKYKKYAVRSKTYLAHNPGDKAQVGDAVTISATRPISKRKSFAITDIRRAPSADALPE
jgi:small subunit ribosomal protein S17